MMMMDFSRCRSKDFFNLLGVTKLTINEPDVAVRTCKKIEYARRNCMKIKEELEEAIKDTITNYKENIIGSDMFGLYGVPS